MHLISQAHDIDKPEYLIRFIVIFSLKDCHYMNRVG